MRTPLFAPLAALLFLLASLGMYMGLRGVVADMSLEVAKVNREVDRKAAESARLSSVRGELAALVDVERRVHGYFVPDTSVVGFISELQSRGSALGSTVEIDSVEAHPTDRTFELALSITGSFDAVMRTVGSIEYAPFDLKATTFSLTYDEGKKVWRASAVFVAGSSEGGGALATPLEQAAPVASASSTPSLTATTSPATTTKPKPATKRP